MGHRLVSGTFNATDGVRRSGILRRLIGLVLLHCADLPVWRGVYRVPWRVAIWTRESYGTIVAIRLRLRPPRRRLDRRYSTLYSTLH